MIRKLLAAVAALLFVAGLGLSTAGTAQAKSVIPARGHYAGTDHHGNHVSFSFPSGSSELVHFYVGEQSFGNAHISGSAWHERCNGGWCFKGQWHDSGYVTGAWRHGGSQSWVTFSAWVLKPYTGPFMGAAHGGADVHFSYGASRGVHGFTVNTYGDFPAVHLSHGGRWTETCSRDWCYKGHFVDDYYAVGYWRTPGSTWHAWEARAYAF